MNKLLRLKQQRSMGHTLLVDATRPQHTLNYVLPVSAGLRPMFTWEELLKELKAT